MGSYCHHSLDHVHRHVAAVFAIGRNTRFRPSAAAVLANPFPHTALLRGPDTTRQNVADAPIVALKIAGSPSPPKVPDLSLRRTLRRNPGHSRGAVERIRLANQTGDTAAEFRP